MSWDVDLVGRHPEQTFLRAMLTEGVERAVAVRGEPGVGKTALIDQFCGDARTEGWRVVRALGVTAEQPFALAGLHQIIFGLQEFSANLDDRSRSILAPIHDSDPGAAVATMPLVGAVLNLLAVAATHEPVLLAVDDAHWLDDVSAPVLSAVGRRLAHPLVRIVAGVRIPGESAFDSAGWTELTLRLLTAQESELLLKRSGTRLPGATLAAIAAVAAGNPLALCELPRCAGQLKAGGGTIPLTDRLVSVFGGRLELLEPAVRGAMLRAALDGSAETTPGAIRPRYVMNNIQPAVDAGLLVIDPLGRAIFRHPLVKSAVVHRADPGDIRDAHHELAELYNDVLMRRAVHLAAAAAEPDQEVADLLVRAANQSSRRGGLEVAIRWLRRAAELSAAPERREALFADAVFVAARAGRLDETDDLLENTDTGSERSASVILADAYREFHHNGDVISSHRWLLHGLSRADSLDDKTVSRLAHLLVSVTNYAGDPMRWEETNAALASIESRLNPAILMYRTAMNDLARVGAELRAVLLDKYVDRLPGLHARQVMLLAFPAYCVDAMTEFRAPLQSVFQQLCGHGASIDAIEGGRVLILDLIATGRWEQAGQIGQTCLEMSQQTQGSELRRHQLLADLGLLAAGRGERDVARTYAAEVRSWATPRRLNRLIDGADRIAVRVALAESDSEGAYRAASRLNPAGHNPRHNIRDAVDDLFDLVEAAVCTGRLSEASERADGAVRLRLAEISPRVEALTIAMSAMTAPDSVAAALYRSALDHPALADFPFERARIVLAQGKWLRRGRNYIEARVALGAAAESFDRLGAHPWAEQARTELRAAETPTMPCATETVVLTGQEQRIAELAVSGLSTRQIAARLCISPRTVDAHLYHAFRKLVITRRSELKAALHQRTLR